MLSTFYRIDVTALTGPTDGGGFIDNKRVEDYMANGGTAPASYTTSKDKERGNVRYQMVQEKVQFMANLYFSNLVATGATVDTAATTFSFTTEVERGDSVLLTHDETGNGIVLTGNAAIKRCVARALMEDRTVTREIYDPTKTTGVNANSAVRYGSHVESLHVGALTNSVATAESAITVTKIQYI